MEDHEDIPMMKNLLLLVALAWVSTSYAKVVKEDLKDVESFKVEKPTEDVKRDVAGGKFKQPKVEKTEASEESESDSEVRYWQYSE